MIESPRLSGLAVLLVEDDPLIAADTLEALEERGIEVTLARSFEEGRRAVERTRFQAAVLDIGLDEDRDALPLADALQGAGVPFLFHTGLGERSVLRTRYPRAPVCRKPCRPFHVVEGLRTVLAAAGRRSLAA
ncbi:response regulator transcription factor [Aureimonas sp. AU4]|uniref:response regulator transcription factor n=1 Tax=Aureimonas sp. AU4 TaxID=1638163 RepID=UPI0007056A1C|nr:response regulator transcription factor [Aureimonas sp. AU4]BAT30384.1 CheY-like receiver [Aureimonas sp. AU4]